MTKDREKPEFATLEQEQLKAIMIDMMEMIYETNRTNDTKEVF